MELIFFLFFSLVFGEIFVCGKIDMMIRQIYDNNGRHFLQGGIIMIIRFIFYVLIISNGIMIVAVSGNDIAIETGKKTHGLYTSTKLIPFTAQNDR